MENDDRVQEEEERDEDLEVEVGMIVRRNRKERKDSVTETIVKGNMALPVFCL